MGKSIQQRAVDFAGDRSQGAGHGYPSWEAELIEKGYIKGAKDQKKLMYKEVFEWLASRDYLTDKVEVLLKEFKKK